MKRNADGFDDAPKNLLFRVTKHCIEVGVRGDATCCVFAEGIRASHRDILYVEVRPYFTRVVFADGRRWVYMTGRELRMALNAYDATGEPRLIEQGTYMLLAPTGVRTKEYRKVARERYNLRKAAGLTRTYSPREVTRNEPPAILKSSGRGDGWARLPFEFASV